MWILDNDPHERSPLPSNSSLLKHVTPADDITVRNAVSSGITEHRSFQSAVYSCCTTDTRRLMYSQMFDVNSLLPSIQPNYRQRLGPRPATACLWWAMDHGWALQSLLAAQCPLRRRHGTVVRLMTQPAFTHTHSSLASIPASSSLSAAAAASRPHLPPSAHCHWLSLLKRRVKFNLRLALECFSGVSTARLVDWGTSGRGMSQNAGSLASSASAAAAVVRCDGDADGTPTEYRISHRATYGTVRTI